MIERKSLESERAELVPDHGGADAGVGEALEYIEMADNRLECDCKKCVDVARSYLIEAKEALSKPAPVAANPDFYQALTTLKDNLRWVDVEPLEALSTHPHASDCDKQGETTKSEGGLNQQARNPVRLPDGNGDLATAGGISGDDIKDPCRQVGGDSPSDRTADVTESELAEWLLNNLSLDAKPEQDARAILDAFTVGRR